MVCTGNICRSPVGEALLADALNAGGIAVTSAGTRAMEGSPPAPQALAYIHQALGENPRREGRQIAKETAEAADLILTMTENQRAWVTRLAPRTVRRTFTMLEFSRVLSELDENLPFNSLSDLVLECAPLRRRANLDGATNDIADPYGGPPEVYTSSFDLVAQASREIAANISDRIHGAAR